MLLITGSWAFEMILARSGLLTNSASSLLLPGSARPASLLFPARSPTQPPLWLTAGCHDLAPLPSPALHLPSSPQPLPRPRLLGKSLACSSAALSASSLREASGSLQVVEMGRRARKRGAADWSPQKPKPRGGEELSGGGEEHSGGGGVGAARFEERQRSFNEREVDRRIAAIQAIRVAETENLLSRLRLVRSYISKEQLEKPALEFFQENLPNLSVTRNEKYKVFELNWNCKENDMLGNCRDGGNMRTSLGYAATLPATAGLQFSVNSGLQRFDDQLLE